MLMRSDLLPFVEAQSAMLVRKELERKAKKLPLYTDPEVLSLDLAVEIQRQSDQLAFSLAEGNSPAARKAAIHIANFAMMIYNKSA